MARRKRKSGGTAEPSFKSFVAFYARTPCSGWPPIFRSDQDAIAWAVAQGAYETIDAAAAGFAELDHRRSGNLWAYWLGHIALRLSVQQRKRK